MSEMLKSKYVILRAGLQRRFVQQVMQASGMSASELALRVGVVGRTVRDWRREKSKISLYAVRKMAKIAHIPIPKYIKLQDRYAHLRQAGVLGGRAVVLKYGRVGGDEEKRKLAWRRWWEKSGRFQESKILNKRKIIKYPRRSTRLAEFIGIVMGDGGISSRQVTVTLNSETDVEFAKYYQKLCNGLFGIRPHLVKIKSCKAVNLIVSRTDLVEWCHKLGLPIGHKIRQRIDIPDWIKKNPRYARFCLRGLVDTDGSVFTHRYRVGGKQYEYKKLDFCTLSKPLLESAYKIFYANGMKPYIAQGKKLRLESQKGINQYFRVIGTSNPKHLRRYRN